MQSILTIALNDLRAVLRERGTRISLFAVPVIMTVFLGLALGGTGSASIRIDVIRADPADSLARKFVSLLRDEAGSQFIVCDLAAPAADQGGCNLSDLKPGTDLQAFADSRVKESTSFAAITIPTGFGADALAGKSTNLVFTQQGGLNAPGIIQQKVNAVLTRMNGAILAARVVAAHAAPSADQQSAFFDSAYATADSIWASDPVVLDAQNNNHTSASSAGFGQSAPGIGEMFVMIGALGLATLFITERRNGTLQRLLTLPVPSWQLLAGKLLGRYLLGLLTFAIMIAVGTLFGVRWGDWPGVIVVVLVYTLAVTAMALAFSTMVRTQGQAAGLALLISLTLSPLGGAWWPLSIVPPWMQTVGRVSPIAWAQDAFSHLLYYGAHLPDILPQMGVLLLFAVVFFAIGISRFRYE